MPVRLVKKMQATATVYYFTFAFGNSIFEPQQSKSKSQSQSYHDGASKAMQSYSLNDLGAKAGQHLELCFNKFGANEISLVRAYTPVSDFSQPTGQFVIAVRIYDAPHGKMGRQLSSMSEGDMIGCRGMQV